MCEAAGESISPAASIFIPFVRRPAWLLAVCHSLGGGVHPVGNDALCAGIDDRCASAVGGRGSERILTRRIVHGDVTGLRLCHDIVLPVRNRDFPC